MFNGFWEQDILIDSLIFIHENGRSFSAPSNEESWACLNAVSSLQVEGVIEKNGNVLDLPKIEGKWDESLTATMSDGSKQVIWKTNPPAADPTR